jgi:hypothetical protein
MNPIYWIPIAWVVLGFLTTAIGLICYPFIAWHEKGDQAWEFVLVITIAIIIWPRLLQQMLRDVEEWWKLRKERRQQ